ncbi:MAG: LLM class F420-dependent oxidoreductase [Myxococcota bacterium]|nr:LLM class F420-dependent oxidoreductase [Myxococcota bacterium]
MNFGAIFPTPEIGTDPAAIRDWAQAAEGLGYSHILLYDHVLGAEHEGRDPKFMGPYTEKDPYHEVFVTMGFLAAVTETIGLSTGVLVLPQRQTALVAKQAAEVDILSQGRLRLGVGTGWNYIEYESLGEAWDDRGKRFDEQVDLLRKLWREPVLDYTGEHHRIDRAGILPKPRPDLPIWFGGFNDVAMRRAAKKGDGFIYGTKPERVTEQFERMGELLEAEGRDPTGFGADASIDFSQGEASWVRNVEVWRDIGGTHLSLRAMDTAAVYVGEKHVGYSGTQSYIDALETFMKAVA